MASQLLYAACKIQAILLITQEEEDKEAMIAVFLVDFGMAAKAEVVAYVSVCVHCPYTVELKSSQKRN